MRSLCVWGLVFAVLFGLSSTVFAKEGYVAGKVYDFDKTTPLKDAVIRLTSVATGKSVEEKSKDEGCYSFKKVEEGTYSVSVSVNGKEYVLPDKVVVEILQKKVVVSVCVALAENNALVMLDNCKVCLGGGFPPVALLLIGGGTAGTITGISVGGGGEPVASPSAP